YKPILQGLLLREKKTKNKVWTPNVLYLMYKSKKKRMKKKKNKKKKKTRKNASDFFFLSDKGFLYYTYIYVLVGKSS
uniref:Uncharacterized protein n=1 Tax=Salvator merianae TaxID=96440 RepID=A0A8D0KJ74_SALMN